MTNDCDCPPDSHGGCVFMCESTTIPSTYSSCSTCGDTAKHCLYIHVRNEVPSTTIAIDQITLAIFKDANSTEFTVCHPVKNWGLTNPPPGPDWNVIWPMTLNTFTYHNSQCTTWPYGVDEEDVVCTPPSGSSPNFKITQCDEWTVLVCGARSVSVTLHWTDGNTNTYGLTPTTLPCPDAGSTHSWCN